MREVRRAVVLLALASWVAGAAAADDATGPLSTAQFPRPIPMGTSCGNWQSSPFIYAGTCGLRVRFFSSPQTLAILSNNHVLGAQGPLLCPNSSTPLQTVTLQPGTLDIGSIPTNPVPNAVGLVAGFVPINFTQGSVNLVDAAVSFTTASLASSSILALGEPTQAVTTPAPGMAVTKTGRTTDTTNGTILSVGTTVSVSYGSDCGVARYAGQIVITPGGFSGPGDSGSAILETSTNIPVGLLFAGSSVQTIANDIRLVYLFLGAFPDAASAEPGDDLASPEALQRAIQSSRDAELERVSAIRARAEADIFRHPDVMGLGVGRNEAGNGFALIVYARGAVAPVASALPARVEGVPVRVVHSGLFKAF